MRNTHAEEMFSVDRRERPIAAETRWDVPHSKSNIMRIWRHGDRYFDLKLDFDSIKMKSFFKMNTISLASRIA
jgi:hypothetical protein